MTQRNSFGKIIPSPNELLKDDKLKEVVRLTLGKVLAHLEVKFSSKAAEEVIALASRSSNISEYEKKGHEILKKYCAVENIPAKRANRSDIVYKQIKSHIAGSNLLDLGCGDGKIGWLFAQDGFNVTLADVYKHPNVAKLELPFALLKQGQNLPFASERFDTTLLVAVLHHSDFPLKTCEEAYRVTKQGGRVIVIETVYGIPPDEFYKLNVEQQRRFNIFIDHFSNRVVQYRDDPVQKINCPFNFQTPEKWKDIFSSRGFIEEKRVNLGFDQPAVLEYHTLYVLRKA